MNQFFQTKSEIVSWLDKNHVRGYTINQDLTVDVSKDVCLQGLGIKRLPVKFRETNSHFDISENELENLWGCPDLVQGHFTVSNNLLTSLAGSPQRVYISFDCAQNKLTSLVGGPVQVGYNYRCSGNMLTDLVGAPVESKGDFFCDHNALKSLKGCPAIINGLFNASSNELECVEYLPEKVVAGVHLGFNSKIKEYEGIFRLEDILIVRDKAQLEKELSKNNLDKQLNSKFTNQDAPLVHKI